MDEARRKVSKAKIAVTLLFAVIAVVAVSLVVEFQVTQAPQLQLDDFQWVSHYDGDLPYVTVEGTIVNSRPVAAKNVTLVIMTYAEGISPHGWVSWKTSCINLGTVSGNSSKHFNEIVYYEMGKY